MSDLVYLGRVRKVYQNPETNYRHATVEPLARSSEDQRRWEGPIENAREEFPDRGYLYWHDAPKELAEGDLRQFEVEDQPHYQEKPGMEAFQVRNPKYAAEIIDLRDIGSVRDIRISLTANGVFLKGGPLGRRCLLWVQDEKWVGPVSLVPGSDTGFWVFSSEQRLESIKCWRIPPEAIQRVELDGTRYLSAPDQDYLGQHIGFINWEPANVLAKRVLDHLRKRDRKTAEALQISKDVFRKYVELIERTELVGSQLAQELAFRDRIKEILDVIEQNEELLDEAASVCFDNGPVKDKIEEKAEEEYQKKLAELETRLDEDLATKKAELKTVAGTLSKKIEELSTVEERIQAQDEKLNERVSGFEAELEQRLRDLTEKPERLFAEMAVAKALVPRARVAVRRQIGYVDPAIPIVKESSALLGELFKRLLDSGISPLVGQTLHSTLLAGLIPVLIGPESYDVISTYANCISGGTLHWIPVGGSIFEPSDLLARFDPISRCLVPHPGGLLDLLLDESDAMHVVVLDGFNRAAVDGYLIPLLRSAQDVALGRKPRSIPLAPPGFTCEDDSYAGVSHLAWNRNVLLVLCPSTGVSTLPVPAELWIHCTVLDAGDPAPVEVSLDSGSAPRISRVPATIWKVWSEGAKEKSGSLEVLRTHPNEAGTLPRVVLGNVERIYRSGTVLGLKHEIALEQAVKTSLFPYLVGTDERVEVWFHHLGFELNAADRRISDAIRRIGE